MTVSSYSHSTALHVRDLILGSFVAGFWRNTLNPLHQAPQLKVRGSTKSPASQIDKFEDQVYISLSNTMTAIGLVPKIKY